MVRLTGRDREMAVLDQVLRGVLAGESAVVQLVADGGMGKSVLLDFIAEQAGSDFVILRGIGCAAEQDHPYALLMSIFDEVSAEERVFDGLDPFEIADLAHALPALRRYQDPSVQSPADPVLIGRALRRSLELFTAGDRALILLVDDLQWADAPSVVALDFLTRHPLATPTLIATATRPHAGLPAVGSNSGALVRVEHIELEPLDQNATQQLVRALPTELRASVLELSDGNPFYLTELTAAALRQPAADDHPRFRSDLPLSLISSTLLEELSEISPAAIRTAQTASVIGDPAQVQLLLATTDADPEQVLAAIDELMNTRLFVPGIHPGTVRFRHPLIAQAIYDSVPEGFRFACHRKAIDVLRSQGAGPLQLARHVEAIATTGDLQATELLAKAAYEAQADSPQTAARLALSTIELIPEGDGDDHLRAEMIRLRAGNLGLSGHADTAISEIAAELERPHLSAAETASLGPLILLLVTWRGIEGATEGNPELVELAVKWLMTARELDSDLSAWAYVFADSRTGMDAEQSLELARGLAARVDDPEKQALGVRIMATVSLMFALRGDARASLEVLDEVDANVARLPMDKLGQLPDVHLMLVSTAHSIGQWQRAVQYGTRAMTVMEQLGASAIWLLFATTIQLPLLNSGNCAEAQELSSLTSERVELLGPSSMLAVVGSVRAAVLTVTAPADQAATALRDVAPAVEAGSGAAMGAHAELVIAWAWMLLEEPAESHRWTADAMAGNRFAELPLVDQVFGYALHCWSACQLGDVPAAKAAADAADQAATPELPESMYWSDRAAAELAAVGGDYARALTESERSINALDDTDNVLGRCIGNLRHADFLLEAGQVQPAIDLYLRIRTESQRLGAIGLTEVATKKLAGLGSYPLEPESGVDQLSARELEIATLVAGGMTSPEVAAELFLSPRTVHAHLRRIFAKLNIHNRAELPEALSAR